LDTANKKYGNSSIKYTISSGQTAGGISKAYSVTGGKYYLAVADMASGNTTYGVRLQFGGVNSIVSTSNSFSTLYAKYAPTIDGSSTLYLFTTSSTAGQYAYVDGVRLYEISQAEYNLIDVDPNWTGSDKISILYPYVDSPVNFVENLFDGELEEGIYSISTGGKSSGSYPEYVRSKNYIPIKSQTRYAYDSPTGRSDFNVIFYDSNKVKLSNANASTDNMIQSPANTAFVTFYCKRTSSPMNISIYEVTNFPSTVYVPFGRWYLPTSEDAEIRPAKYHSPSNVLLANGLDYEYLYPPHVRGLLDITYEYDRLLVAERALASKRVLSAKGVLQDLTS
jgi:hypothetical protein